MTTTTDPLELFALAARIQAGAERAGALAGLAPGPLSCITHLGPAEVSRSAVLFVRSWQAELESVAQDAHRIAEAVRLAARDYASAELLVHALFG